MSKIVPVSLIIPTYNRQKSLRITLDSFLKCNTVPSELIIADQSNNDIFVVNHLRISKIEKMLPNIKITHFKPSDIGITIARNEAMKLASNNTVIFSDDDVVANENTIKDTFNLMSLDSTAAIGGLDFNTYGYKNKISLKGIIKIICGIEPLNSSRKGAVSFGLFGKYPTLLKKETITDWMMGYYFAVKKSLISKYNINFEEKFKKYGYAEDLDFSIVYCKKAKKDKKKCILSPEIGVYHEVTKEYRIDNPTLYSKVFINRQYINFKLHGKNIFRRILLSWANFTYYLMNRKCCPNLKNVYKHFKIVRKTIVNGNLDQDCYFK